MEKERFEYLMNSPLGELSPEDAKEAEKLRKDVMPILCAVFLRTYEGY